MDKPVSSIPSLALNNIRSTGAQRSSGAFPSVRMRRTRQADWSRRLVSEHEISANNLILPIFVIEGENTAEPVSSMPGVERLTIDKAIQAAEEAAKYHIPAIALFPFTNPDLRTETGEEALNPDNLVCRATRAIKDAVPDIGIICDVALDPYTSHGHDGIIIKEEIANDETLEILVKQTINQAEAGADILAPSDMMDGRVGAMRDALEVEGFHNTLIMSYAAKYASAFYGPFRDAIGSSNTLKGHKHTYQMDPANSDEGIREVALDIAEGADMLLVKPGMPYLDMIRRIKDEFALPTFAYQVSGEYAMISAAAQNGWLDGDRAMTEALLSFKRSGADGIFTYYALELAKKLNNQNV